MIFSPLTVFAPFLLADVTPPASYAVERAAIVTPASQLNTYTPGITRASVHTPGIT